MSPSCLSSCKGPGRNVNVTAAHLDPQGRRRPELGPRGQVFYNSEYGELAGAPEESSSTPATRAPFFTDSSY